MSEPLTPEDLAAIRECLFRAQGRVSCHKECQCGLALLVRKHAPRLVTEVERLAVALAAEREECAKIADRWAASQAANGEAAEAVFVAEAITRDIRARKEVDRGIQ